MTRCDFAAAWKERAERRQALLSSEGPKCQGDKVIIGHSEWRNGEGARSPYRGPPYMMSIFFCPPPSNFMYPVLPQNAKQEMEVH